MVTLVTGDTLDKAAALLKALDQLNRLQMVNILMNGERHVGELEKILGIKQSTTSIQLSKLKRDGVLKSRRDSNKTYYFLANNGVKRIVKSIIAEIR
ncbi:ArsR/SmtB family transcription factor [Candidatus Latescibacterota bacterium]